MQNSTRVHSAATGCELRLVFRNTCADCCESRKVLSAWGRGSSQQATIQIQQDGPKLSGTFQDSEGSLQLTGSVAGNNLSFSVQLQGRPVTVAFTGSIDGDKMSGTFQPQGGSGGRGRRGGGQGNQSWSAVRQ